MTLLTAINSVQRLCSLEVTSTVVANSQETQKLLLELAKEAADELARRHYWPDLKREHTFTATTGQTLQSNGKPSDFDRIIPDTMWNRTTDRQIHGVLTPSQWQRAKGLPLSVTIDQLYMLRNDGLHIFGPDTDGPTDADTIAYEYMMNTPVLDTDGSTYKTEWEADTDTFVLSERLLINEVRWRWRAEKGLPYAEQLKNSELRIASEINATRSGSPVHVAHEPINMVDGQITDGSWDLP